MEEIGLLMHGFAVALQPENLLLMFVGVVLGVLIGVLPGLGGANGIQPGETITVEFTTTVGVAVEGCCNQAQVTFAEAAVPQPSDDPATPGRVERPNRFRPPRTSSVPSDREVRRSRSKRAT